MKKLITVLFGVLISGYTLAAHIVGGDMYYDYLGNDNYRITVVIFRDCASTGAAYDNPMNLGVYDMNKNLVREVSIPFPGSQVLSVVLNNPCVTPPTGICTEQAIYTRVINLPPTFGGYTVSYQRCCRGPNVTNLIAPEDTGLTLTVHITGIGSNALVNSSPRFKNYPPLVICNNDELVFDHSATDLDGDELIYELITPYAGASDVNPQPQPPLAPPYAQVNFAGGYTAANPLGAGASISLNPLTGQLIADPELLGLFVVGIRVKEFRNGVFIGQSDRDFLFKVVNCVIQLEAKVVPQTESSSFISFCQGYTAEFENDSYGGTNYFWDFGVDTLDSDTSNLFTPTYTFPGVGVYEVMLVVNPGWPCTDTSFQTFTILDSLTISYTVQDSICITGNSFDFDGYYDGPTNPQFVWSFGPNANMSTANTLDVNGVVFSQSGYIPVTLAVEAYQCLGSYTDYIFIYDEPVIKFGIDAELKCAPYLAQFIDSSTSYAPLIYYWDFGDGDTSSLENPTHNYDTPGVFDVTLTIESTEGCIGTHTLMKDDLIRVYPNPIAEFSITPQEQTVFNPFFYATDESYDSDIIFYIYNDTMYTYERNPEFSFVESGGHIIYQVVENEFGCRDTTLQKVTVIPQTTLFVPNTFTPDGNNLNNEFLPIVHDVFSYKLSIFDRWGELLFTTTDIKEGWDGTYRGKNCKDGTYTYKIEYTDIQSREIIVKTGFVNLLR